MKPLGSTALALTWLAVGLLSGCATTSDGVAVRAEEPTSHGATTSERTRSSPTSPPTSESPVFGVVPTTRALIAPNSTTCTPTTIPVVAFTAEVTDPAAPIVTVGVPKGFSASAGRGDVGLTLTGPDGMSASVTIAPTVLDPAEAFTQYGDTAMDAAPISTLSVLPGDFCGYSGQRTFGTWAETPGRATEFADRITHVWTNSKNYLVTVHLQGPAGAAGFDAAEAVLTAEFGVVIP